MSNLTSNVEAVEENFSQIDLTQQTIVSGHFEECVFEDCQFNETLFQYCRFVDCTFRRCDLSLAGFPDSRFSKTTFAESKCIGINWAQSMWEMGGLGKPIGFENCTLNYGVFIGMDCEGIEFKGCQAVEVDFREANLARTNFQGTDLLRALFQNSDLTGADFSRARNYTIDPRENKLAGGKFALPDALGLLTPLQIKLID